MDLKAQLMAMGNLVSTQMQQATDSFLKGDLVLAQQVIDNDAQINQAEIELDQKVFDFLIRQNPMASNFRETMAILKASADLERIGDSATKIARQTLRISNKPTFDQADPLLKDLIEQVNPMLMQINQAFSAGDVTAAYQVANDDLKVDQLYLNLRHLIFNQQVADKPHLKASDVYLIVSRQLERASDHIVNIAEWIVYAQTGELVELNPGKTDPDLLKK